MSGGQCLILLHLQAAIGAVAAIYLQLLLDLGKATPLALVLCHPWSCSCPCPLTLASPGTVSAHAYPRLPRELHEISGFDHPCSMCGESLSSGAGSYSLDTE